MAISVFDGVFSASSVGKGGGRECLAAVQRGERFVHSYLNEASIDEGESWNHLSRREREILPLMAKGPMNRKIAAEIFIA